MASKVLITPEQYLATHFEREPEFVHGELVEKSLPKKKHARTQQRLCVLLDRAGYGCTELRVKLAHDLYRIPDFALYESEPEGELPDTPPLLIIEIASPDDRRRDVEQKLEEYRAWGVAHVWFVEPESKKLYIWNGGLVDVAQFELPRFHPAITPADLFS
jgi:Uma2 family endonuclease